MNELLQVLTSPWNFLWTLVAFGFAPGFCLRLIVLAYPRDDPRRQELIAELYAVPRINRPLWVAEQLEVALFEGLGQRFSAVIRWCADRRGARTRMKESGRRWRVAVSFMGDALPFALVTAVPAGLIILPFFMHSLSARIVSVLFLLITLLSFIRGISTSMLPLILLAAAVIVPFFMHGLLGGILFALCLLSMWLISLTAMSME
jgi:hypothetical protein